MSTRCTFLAVSLMVLLGCSGSQPVKEESIPPPATRQLAPEPAYSRLTWEYRPRPVPGEMSSGQEVPYLEKIMTFDLRRVPLCEAIRAVGRTIGYRGICPGSAGKQRITVKVRGTVDDILEALARESGVVTEIDHEARLVRVLEVAAVRPRLPGSSAE